MYRITRDGVYAFNRETGERMTKPKWPSYTEYAHDSEWYPVYYRYVSEMKVWDAFVAALPDDYRYKRPNLVHAKEKGIPVPRTGSRRWHSRKDSGKSGVIGNSRVLPHRYMDEGDKGATHNRHIKRVERAQWRSEALEELREERSAYDAETVAQWFYDSTDDVDSDIIPSVYTVGETVVEWPNDYYDEYEYDYSESYGCGDPYCDICGDPYEEEPEEDFCAHCGGPCEL